MTEPTDKPGKAIDIDAASRLVDALEQDLARLKTGQGDLDRLRADIEELRSTLASARQQDVHGGLAGLRERLHAVSDELLDDALKTGDYIARIGRLLGM